MKASGPIAALCCAIAMLGGCMDRDPYRRTDVWRPTGANAANIAAQVADPRDLIRGQGSPRLDTAASTLAIDRLRTDNPRSINPATRSSAAGGQSTGGQSSGTSTAGAAQGGEGISLAPPGG